MDNSLEQFKSRLRRALSNYQRSLREGLLSDCLNVAAYLLRGALLGFFCAALLCMCAGLLGASPGISVCLAVLCAAFAVEWNRFRKQSAHRFEYRRSSGDEPSLAVGRLEVIGSRRRLRLLAGLFGAIAAAQVVLQVVFASFFEFDDSSWQTSLLVTTDNVLYGALWDICDSLNIRLGPELSPNWSAGAFFFFIRIAYGAIFIVSLYMLWNRTRLRQAFTDFPVDGDDADFARWLWRFRFRYRPMGFVPNEAVFLAFACEVVRGNTAEAMAVLEDWPLEMDPAILQLATDQQGHFPDSEL
ncbi:MAG: hypothetical protein KDB14_20485 [Planctomycetales bacterium]|nr:hypothetical protein [Planctomycetales bacterium]